MLCNLHKNDFIFFTEIIKISLKFLQTISLRVNQLGKASSVLQKIYFN